MRIIKENTTGKEELQTNEYYALMVTDDEFWKRKRTDYIDFEKRWIGLECASGGETYLSKRYAKRKNLRRGITVIVELHDEKYFIL